MSEQQTDEQERSIGKRANELNAAIRYTMWSVFKLARPLGEDQRAAAADEVTALFDELAGKDVVVRGVYDVAGLRADADVMVWWHAETPEALQEAYTRLRRTTLGRHLDPVWSQMALHRPAEFNRSHIPAFLADEEPRRYVCVYPFVRSYEWYLLPDEERRFMLAEHGKMARGYPDVRANTVASFALGDYEWMLAFEADDAAPHRRPHARAAGLDRAAARARGGAVLHRRPEVDRGARRRPRLTCQVPLRAMQRQPAPTAAPGASALGRAAAGWTPS